MWGKLVGVLVAAVVGQHVVRLVSMLNMFQKVFNHAPGPCRQLNNVKHGAEDAYLLSNGLLFISSGFGRPSGKMLRLDLGASDSDTEEFLIEGNFDASTFATHGIGAWEDPKTGEVTLFAVNHNKDGERVEVFRHDGTKTSNTLRYVKTIQGPQIPYLNDIVATGPNSFYGTHMFTLGMREDFLLMYPGGDIIHYDGEKALVVATGLTLANGINMSPDKRNLYVAESRGNIRTYEIQNDKTLHELQVYDTGSSPDNIYVDPDSGDLWLGCHPNTYKTTLYVSSLGKNYNTYSQVLRLKVDKGKITDTWEVYANDGSEIKGSTIAIPYKKNLFIGTIADRAVVCGLVYSG